MTHSGRQGAAANPIRAVIFPLYRPVGISKLNTPGSTMNRDGQ